MAGLDVTLKALVFPEDFERIRAVGNRVAVVVAEWLDFFYNFHRSLGYTGAPVHDAVAVAALIKPEILTARDYYVQIETSGDFCRGATVQTYGFTNQPPRTWLISTAKHSLTFWLRLLPGTEKVRMTPIL